jgi:N-acetylmuramoyl-L-alanine amidase
MSMDVCISAPRLFRSTSRIARTLVVVALTLGTTWAKGPQKVTDVRFWTTGETTRVAIEVSGEFSYKSDRLTNPDRVFFDIEESRVALKAGRPEAQNVADKRVRKIRLAQQRGDISRVVIDLEPGVDYTVSQLSNPERLMVELRSSKGPKSAPTATPTTAPTTTPATPTAPVPTQSTTPAAPTRTAPQANIARVNNKTTVIPAAFAAISGSTFVVAPAPVAPIPSAPSVAASVRPMPVRVTDLPDTSAPVIDETPVASLPEPAPQRNIIEPKAAQRNVNGDRSLTRVLGLKLGRVVIDAGHGGHDQGTHSKGGLLEKDVVLDVSNRLARMLRDRMGTDVVMTRDDDTYLPLEERTRIANEVHADLFLSIHANSSPAKTAAGVETFYLNFTTGTEDLDLATRENASSERSIGELKEVVSKIALRAKLDESRDFATRVQTSLQTTATKYNKESKDRGIKRAPFVVLIGAEMPSVLAEIGFLTNARDEALLKSPDHRERIAESLYKGIAEYAESLSHATQVAHAASK